MPQMGTMRPNSFGGYYTLAYGRTTTLLAVGTFWFESTNEDLFQWNGVGWDSVAVTVDDVDPVALTAGEYWFNTTTNKLLEGTGGSPLSWIEQPAIVWPEEAKTNVSCLSPLLTETRRPNAFYTPQPSVLAIRSMISAPGYR